MQNKVKLNDNLLLHYQKYIGRVVQITQHGAPVQSNWTDTLNDRIAYNEGELYACTPFTNHFYIEVDRSDNNEQAEESFLRFLKENPRFPKDLLNNPKNLAGVYSPGNSWFFYMKASPEVDTTRIPRTHERYPGLKFCRPKKDLMIIGGQIVNDGWYSFGMLCVHDILRNPNKLVVE